MSLNEQGEWLNLPDAPAIKGLRFRHCRGEEDYPIIATVLMAESEADHLEYAVFVEDVERSFRHLENCDPVLDFLFAEVDGREIAYSETWWAKDPSGNYLYDIGVHMLPQWRGKGIRDAMLRHCERRLREVAENHPRDGPRLFQMVVMESEKDMISILENEGYSVFRYGLKLRRPDLENIPDLPLPESVEIRPVRPEHVRLVIDAWNEACRDMRGQIPISEETARHIKESPLFDPSIWQVAWNGDKVIGTVMNFIDKKENEMHKRERGHVEMISVQRAWRGKGIAKMMIARSLKLLKEKGMTEAALGVDEENPSGALHLYEKMGFKVEKRAIFYRKPVD